MEGNLTKEMKALKFFKDSLEIFQTFPDKKREVAQILSTIAIDYMNDFQYGLATNILPDALKTFEEVDDKQSFNLVFIKAFGVIEFGLK